MSLFIIKSTASSRHLCIFHHAETYSSFLEELKSGKSTPLKDVTSGYHYHTVSADSGETLDLIGQELGKKGYLCQ